MVWNLSQLHSVLCKTWQKNEVEKGDPFEKRMAIENKLTTKGTKFIPENVCSRLK